MLHDVCMQKLHVIFAIDRAGLVGADGETHQGCFDLSYLSMMPNMTVLAPKNDKELADMLAFAVDYDGPVAIRYPRGSAYQGLQEYQAPVEYGKSEIIHRGKKIAVLGVGSMIPSCLEVCQGLKADGYDPTFVNARFVKPLDVDLLDEFAKDHDLFVTVEENMYLLIWKPVIRRQECYPHLFGTALCLREMWTVCVPGSVLAWQISDRQ